jgi:hypothetical protein
MTVISKRSLFGPVVAILVAMLTTGLATANEFNIDSAGDLSADRKVATITVSIECTAPGNVTIKKAYIFQSVGRLLNIGTLSSVNPDPIVCSGLNTVDTFTVDIATMGGTQFQSGPASALLLIEYPGSPTVESEKGAKVNLHK